MEEKKIRIKDLCPEEKRKIGELLKKLSSETDEKEKFKKMLDEDKKIYEEKIRSLETSIQQQSMISNYNDFKAESFSQSFIADKNKPTLNDIKVLRKKFDSAFETLKKVSMKNEYNSSLTNNDSLIEERPISKIPNPIKQDDFMNSNMNIPSISNDEMNEKSFISNIDNELINNIGNINISIRKNNNNNSSIKSLSTNSNTIGNNRGNTFKKNNNNHHNNFGSKYKEMLNRIKEKSQEKAREINEGKNMNFYFNKVENHLKNNNIKNNNNNLLIYNENKNIRGSIEQKNIYSKNDDDYNNFNNLSNCNSNCPNHYYKDNSIENGFHSEFKNENSKVNDSSNNQSNFSIDQYPLKQNEFDYIPQTKEENKLNINHMSFNNNLNKTINDNEYENVINLLNSNKETITSNLNNTEMENNVSNFLLTLENKENKKKCNLNVFNYIMQLEEKEKLEKMQNEKKELPEENKIIDKSKEITNQIQELEEQIQNLTLEQEKYEDRTKITPEQLQNIYKTDKTKLFEDFKKINSKYI